MGLDEWRKQIDDLDRQLLRSLGQRAELSVAIGRAKREAGQPVFVPERERALVDELVRLSGGPLKASSVRAIWRDPFVLARPAAALPGGALRPPRDIHPPGRGASLRERGAVSPDARDLRGLCPRRARRCRRGRGARGELHGRVDQPHARLSGGLRAPGLRGDPPGDPPLPPVAGAGAGRDQARVLPPAADRPVP